ncbi:MAG TPA: hypothetical protein VKH20_00040 [Solirubrobacterales bacterium]|nr:hypothetical protein [Solirubrobacterales bacterium]
MSDALAYIAEFAESGYQEHDAPRFIAAWDRLESAYFERLSEVCAAASEWRECLRAAAEETARLVEDHRPQTRFLVVDALRAGPLGRERQRALSHRLAQKLDAARAELLHPEAIPSSTAPWVVAMFFDRIYRRCTVEDAPDLFSQLPELLFLAISAYFGTEVGLRELLPPF